VTIFSTSSRKPNLLEASDGLTPDTFLADATLQRALVRSLEIIGEATKKLPDSSPQILSEAR
jgi:uncharacterized protein with HEPN domain